MNTKCLLKTVFALLFVLSGCADNAEMMDTVSENSSTPPELSTRAATTGWENCIEGYLPSGEKIFLPWYNLP